MPLNLSRYTPTKHDTPAAQALAAAIVASRASDGAPLREQRGGRVDRTRLSRLACRDNRVFYRPGAPAPKKLRVAIILDASGSMASILQPVAQMGRNLIEAMSRLPNVYAECWSHRTLGNMGVVWKLWEKGEPTTNIDAYFATYGGSNMDGMTIAYVADELAETIKSDERGLIIMVSDGQPAYMDIDGLAHTKKVVDDTRKRGFAVVSVSISADLTIGQQRVMYGKENVVAYDANMQVVARAMAKVIGHNMG